MNHRLRACRRSLVHWVSLLALSANFIATSVHAQNKPDAGLEEVTIVATRLDTAGTSLSRVPANAQVLTTDDIQRRNPTNMADLLNGNLGSVSVSNGVGNPYQNDVNYRGFQATSLLGAPVGLAVYFDGVRVNEPFGSIVNWDLIPMNAIANVQIQPGSNPIFGLNTLGGALLVNTRNGRDHAGITISALGGSFHRWAGTVEVGGSSTTTDTDYFLAGNYDRQEGFRDHSGSTVRQLFGKARWHAPDERTQIELSGVWADTALQGTQALPMDMLANPRAAYTWPDAIDNHMRLVDLKARRQLDDANQLSTQVYYRQSNALSLNSNADLDDGCFNDDGSLATTVTGFRCADAALDGTAINAVTGAAALALGFGRWTNTINSSVVVSDTRQDTVGASAQWTNIAPVLDHKNALIIGGTFDRSNIHYHQDTMLARLIDFQTRIIPNLAYGFTVNGLPPSSSNPPVFTGSNTLASVTLGSRLRQTSLYLTDTLDLTSKLSLTISGSYDDTAIDQSGVNNQYLNDDGGYSWTDGITGVTYYNSEYLGAFRYANTAAGVLTTPNGVPSGALPGPESSSLDGSHRYRRFNPRVGFNYNFNAFTGLFGSYSQSMRAPTSIELSCADPNNPCALPTGFNGDPNLKAVTARTFELGARGRVAGDVWWNAAFYDSRLHDDIQFIATSNTYGYFSNVGDTGRRGFELSVQQNFDRLVLSANYGYVDARYRSPFTTITGADVRSGNHIPGISASTIKLRAGYQVTDNFRMDVATISVGQQYAHGNENNADPNGKVPGYVIVDLDAQYRIGALRFSLNIDNLFDRTYATYGLSGMTSIYSLAAVQFRTPAPPRGAWLKVSYAL